jgi:PPOX class probable FMN-dependent enzyme
MHLPSDAPPADPHLVTSEDALAELYAQPLGPSLHKVADHLTATYRAMLEASPFCVLATVGPEGLDCSPRGDEHGLVQVRDERTLLLPDRRGNNRLDSLRNIVRDGRVALLFLVPGASETLRVNGRAVVSADPALCARFEVDGKAPRTVVVITVEAVYFQCARALVRSHLWDPARQVPRAALPTAGAMLAEASGGREGGEDYDRALPARQAATLY